MRLTFAIIGGGLTGTTMLYQFVDTIRKEMDRNSLDLYNIKILIFEKQETFGPGLPHNDRNVMSFHITNMCAKDMGIKSGDPADFQKWVISHRSNLKEFMPRQYDESFNHDQCNHYPRAIMGEYLREKFTEAQQKAQALGVVVDLYSLSEVFDLEEKDDKIYLTVKDLRSGSVFSCVADRVLLATGHWFEKMAGNKYVPSPWPAGNLLQSIPEGEKVGIIGTSLSAIEVVLTLSSDGHFLRDDSGALVYVPPPNPRRFVLYSRRGLLPKVRGKTGKYRNKYFTRENLESLVVKNKGSLKLEDVFQVLNLELEAAYGHEINWQEVVNPHRTPSDMLQQYLEDAILGDGPDGELIWQTVLYQSFDMVREIYLWLSLRDRERFDKNYTSVFFTHAASQPALNAEKMLALMKAGFVEVIKLGKDYEFVKNNTKDVYEFIYKDPSGGERRDAYRYIVNARGQAKSIESDPSSLTKNLLKRGIVQINEIQYGQKKSIKSEGTGSQQRRKSDTYKTGSVWIDPKTHKVIRHASHGEAIQSNSIYAVGAMTRGQIIDSSMAHGIVQSTAKIAEGLVAYLKQFTMGANH